MRSFLSPAVLLAGISTWTDLATGQLLDNPPITSFLRRSFATGELLRFPTLTRCTRLINITATVLGDFVYIDGGEISQLVGGSPPTGDRPSNPGMLEKLTHESMPLFSNTSTSQLDPVHRPPGVMGQLQRCHCITSQGWQRRAEPEQ